MPPSPIILMSSKRPATGTPAGSPSGSSPPPVSPPARSRGMAIVAPRRPGSPVEDAGGLVVGCEPQVDPPSRRVVVAACAEEGSPIGGGRPPGGGREQRLFIHRSGSACPPVTPGRDLPGVGPDRLPRAGRDRPRPYQCQTLLVESPWALL